MTNEDEVTRIARDYYDSSDADEFYYRVWGGEDIHIGLYKSETESIRVASRRTVDRMADELSGQLGPKTRVLDCGSGYGGPARHLAARYGCHVDCLNISKVQNERNLVMTKEAGLTDQIGIFEAPFEALPFENHLYDVVWSQDAFVHSGDKGQVFREVARVLKPGGTMLFTDLMEGNDCPSGVLDVVRQRIHLDSMGSINLYRSLAREVGMQELAIIEMTDQMVRHYRRVKADLTERVDELSKFVSRAYIERMTAGLQHWVDAGERGYLAWGILRFGR